MNFNRYIRYIKIHERNKEQIFIQFMGEKILNIHRIIKTGWIIFIKQRFVKKKKRKKNRRAISLISSNATPMSATLSSADVINWKRCKRAIDQLSKGVPDRNTDRNIDRSLIPNLLLHVFVQPNEQRATDLITLLFHAYATRVHVYAS